MTSFSTVFQRFPKTFVRFSKILQKLSKVQTIISGHFRTFSRTAKDFGNNRRFLGKIRWCFDDTGTHLSTFFPGEDQMVFRWHGDTSKYFLRLL